MVSFLTLITVLGSIFGALLFIVGAISAKGAPQEAASAAMAMAMAVIPYVLLRCATLSERRGVDAELLKAIKANTPAPAALPPPAPNSAPQGLGSTSPRP